MTETSAQRRARRGRPPFWYRAEWTARRLGVTSPVILFGLYVYEWHDCGGVCYVPTCTYPRCQRAQKAAARGRARTDRRR